MGVHLMLARPTRDTDGDEVWGFSAKTADMRSDGWVLLEGVRATFEKPDEGDHDRVFVDECEFENPNLVPAANVGYLEVWLDDDDATSE